MNTSAAVAPIVSSAMVHFGRSPPDPRPAPSSRPGAGTRACEGRAAQSEDRERSFDSCAAPMGMAHFGRNPAQGDRLSCSLLPTHWSTALRPARMPAPPARRLRPSRAGRTAVWRRFSALIRPGRYLFCPWLLGVLYPAGITPRFAWRSGIWQVRFCLSVVRSVVCRRWRFLAAQTNIWCPVRIRDAAGRAEAKRISGCLM